MKKIPGLKIKGIKRLSFVLILALAPMVWAEPFSVLQQSPRQISAVIKKANPLRPAITADEVRRGVASWYSETDAGINLYTANGEVFEDSRLTCAAWNYPFGTRLKVTNISNGKSVICRVNDRGPAKRLNRVIDLTRAAFGRIANLKRGLIKVKVERVK